jgi:Predicted AAA-ATPase/PD-(D/E)XK nuclease superfamily
MKYLPTDVSTFSTMITGNYLYIDKTRYIYDLFKRGTRYYFLSRPRRFGKTLLISTLKELFLGNKSLFQELWISISDYDWQEYPIIDLDFSRIAHSTPEELKVSLTWGLMEIAKQYGIDISQAPTLTDKVIDLIQKLSQHNKVVILIDEYDKPILDHLHDIEMARTQREVLRSFYDVLKGLDQYLRVIFITGVTKFSKTSLFSGINNLNDISLKPGGAALLGYTSDEITTYLKDYIANFTFQKGISPEAIVQELRGWYNGYRFSEEEITVYNPFSVLYALNDQKFKNYWFESGTPSFLINLIKKQFISLEDIQETEVAESSLGTFEIDNIPLITLLFQTGYLTITHYNKQNSKYTLGYPNFEVEESFKKYLVATLAQTTSIVVDKAASRLIEALNNNDIANFCTILQTLFAHIPYTLHIERESYYHSLFQLIMNLLSLEAQSEILTNRGRIDMTVTTKTHVYIFELKLNGTASEALQQIKEKRYYERYISQSRHIVLVGLTFNVTKEKLSLECSQEGLS